MPLAEETPTQMSLEIKQTAFKGNFRHIFSLDIRNSELEKLEYSAKVHLFQ